MFHDFYQMLEEPFGVSPDPRFLFVGASHREALASLFYGIETNRGVMVLVAPPGSGKTTLIHQLIGKIKPSARTVFLFQTQCTSAEMMQYLLNDLGVDVQGMERVAMHNHLYRILTQERRAGRRFVLIVDEAQNLEPGVLETIRLLSNFETSRQKLLQILLVGQPQLARKLAGPGLDQLSQRISICARLRPFTSGEIPRYIAHRLKVAGYSGNELFTTEAINIIEDRSKGIARNINRLCFSALSLGYAMGRDQIDAAIVNEVVADLQWESLSSETSSAPLVLLQAKKPTAHHKPFANAHSGERHQTPKIWALGGVAATLLIALGLFQYSRGGMEPPLPAKTATASPAIEPPPPAPLSMQSHVPASQTKELPVSATAAPAAVPQPSVDEEIATANFQANTRRVVVRPGETLQRIALRTLGRENSKLIRQIQELNPQLKDPDHIEADQEIRLPQVPPESPSVPQ